ncbi:Serine/threonine protein kinase PrkC, regulator of stationary phase [Fimbriiglobus ruber]|uniref:Serine/threonine protein kinase PrkC, regulator of stationary phase n=2 Tax=Fimbriiglobus ruber TaxID=1908690 RepID=A0A225DAG0_9BACT|nr:Serine/threonine protein kinase PrkC, regulator of stationary phase [Fimbriiglobus ruber]
MADPQPVPVPGLLPLDRRVGQYRLVERIGHGGMGTVYRAEHLRLKKMVAVKLLAADRLADPGAVGRFEREMAVVGRLDHPNIVRATDAGDADGVHFLAMELVDGLDLGAVNRRCRPLAVADACEIARRAALGLQHAHEHGLVHRDVKPQNLMLSRKGEVKVLDLGLALFRAGTPDEDALTATGQLMGTANYMAPEQFDGCHTVDIRADLYSLGCTLYALLAGQPPFGGPEHKSIFGKMTAHKTKPVPRVTAARPDVPPGLVAVLDALLAKDPAARPSVPAEVATALEPFASGADLPALALVALIRGDARDTAEHATVTAANSTPVVSTRTATPGRRRRWAAAVVAGAVAATVGGAVWLSRRPAADLVPEVPAGLLAPRVPVAGDDIKPDVAALEPRISGRWYDLLKTRPTEFHWWDPKGINDWKHDPARGMVRVVYANNTGLLSFGRADSGGFRLQIGFQQPAWTGDFGLFFGGKRSPDGQSVRFQYLRFASFANAGEQQFRLYRGQNEIANLLKPPPLVRPRDWVSSEVTSPDQHEQELTIEVGHAGLQLVKWNEMKCHDLLTVNEKFSADDYTGEYGIYFFKTNFTVVSAKLKPTD